MPEAAPDSPWAIHLTGADHRFRLLALDFDSGPHGADVARTDADRMGAHLDELGVAYLRTHSGPTGGQHVWIRLAEPGAAADDVRELARVLRQAYPSLDASALSNPSTGATRPPGAPHRLGGHSLPHLQGPALEAALDRMAVGTPPDVVDWLLSRHPHTVTVTRDARSRAVRIVEDASGPRLDRPRRALSDHTLDLLATRPSRGADRSAIAHSILLGMAHAGWTLIDAQAAVDSAPGLIRLRADRDRGRDDTARQWARAVDQAAAFVPVVVADRSPVDDDMDRFEAAVTADPTRWARPGGASDERILHALIVLARTGRTCVLDVDVRRLAEAAAVDASTVSRRLRVLSGEGWVTRVRESAGTRAATWQLNPPSMDATQGNPPPSPGGTSRSLLAHHTHDAWTHRAGLGSAAARIHWAAANFGKHVNSASHRVPLAQYVSQATGYTTSTVTRTLDRLRALGLFPAPLDSATTARLDRAARLIGTAGTAARRILRHLVDRELHRWWTEELEWRGRRGKKRGVRTSTGTIALPITAPARARYGRFPTRDDGRADYSAGRAIVTAAVDMTAAASEAA